MQALFRIVQDDSPPIPEGASGVSFVLALRQFEGIDESKWLSLILDGQRLYVSMLSEGSKFANHGSETG